MQQQALPKTKKETWICRECCWHDGNAICLKDDKFNFDGDGIVGVTGCSGFIAIEKERKQNLPEPAIFYGGKFIGGKRPKTYLT